MKEFLFILGLLLVLLTIIGVRDSTFKATCHAHGGTPVIGQYGNTCYAPGVAIDVN